MSLIWTHYPFDDNNNRVFDDTFGSLNRPRFQHGGGGHQSEMFSFRPRLDVHESRENNIVTATMELPGLKKEDIAIDVHNGRLTVSGARSEVASRETRDGYVVRERRAGNFSRELVLPTGVTADEIAASLADGVLTITYPGSKLTPDQDVRRIAVN